MKGLQTAKDPSALIRVLRYIFRSFHHTKIEALFREFAPLLPMAVHTLLVMLEVGIGKAYPPWTSGISLDPVFIPD